MFGTVSSKAVKELEEVALFVKTGHVANVSTALYCTSNGGTGLLAHYTPEDMASPCFALDIMREEASDSLILRVAFLREPRRKVLQTKRHDYEQ